jgi:hypothetical protein
MADFRQHGRPLTSISEVQQAAHDGVDLLVSGEVIPAANLYATSFRFVADQIEHGTIAWCEPAEEVA